MENNTMMSFRISEPLRVQWRIALLNQRVKLQYAIEAFASMMIAFDKGESSPDERKVIEKIVRHSQFLSIGA